VRYVFGISFLVLFLSIVGCLTYPSPRHIAPAPPPVATSAVVAAKVVPVPSPALESLKQGPPLSPAPPTGLARSGQALKNRPRSGDLADRSVRHLFIHPLGQL
jgi:hypothetical protein